MTETGQPVESRRGSVSEVARLFLKLGLIAFGGPAAHISMMRQEAVVRRGWLDDAAFLDLVGGANLIPGPSSTQVALFLGYLRAGPRGLMVGGVLFIVPAMLIVLALAWGYVRYGSLPAAGWLLYGVKPVVIAIVVQALFGLARSSVRSALLALVGIAAMLLSILGVSPVALLAAGGFATWAIRGVQRGWRKRNRRGDRVAGWAALPGLGMVAPHIAAAGAASVSLLTLFLTFLKIGAVLYGGGYVLLAFVQADFVRHLGWLSNKQVLDAVAVGQLTPGPLFTTATFIGYLVAGVPGALLSTLAIFLPSFVYAPIVFPLIPRLRRSATFSSLLDGVNVAALGLMASVTWTLGRAAIVDVFTACLAAGCLALLVRLRVSSAWLVLAGGAGGIVYRLLGM